MPKLEDDVSAAALTLRDTIAAATAGGYVIAWPASAAGLDALSISETAAVKAEAPAPAAAAAKPVITGLTATNVAVDQKS